MSDPHRPFGDIPDEHDLRREARTDAPDDADALDALLNEIVTHNGSPGTRSGNGHDRPDAPSDDSASVMVTAAGFHRWIEMAQARDTRAAGPDSRLWETIMERTGTPAGDTTGARIGRFGPSHAAPDTARTAPIASRQRAARRQQAWNTIANIGLAAALLLAAIGVWRLAGGPGLPGDSDGSQPAANLAMQPATADATPASTEREAANVPHVATPEPITGCDLDADIPILTGVDESPWDGTAVLLTTSGDIVLTCPEVPEGKVLTTTSQYNSVIPMVWPSVVLVPSFGEPPEEARARVVSLVTGEVVEFGLDVESLGVQTTTMSPWLAGPAPGDPADVQLLDLRTMQTRLISEIAGASPPEHGSYLSSGNSAGGTLVLGLQTRHTTESNGTLLTDSGLPGDLLVLDGSLDAATWIPVPEDFPPVVGLDVSPDGTHVALHGVTDEMSADREDVYSLVRLRDGAEIERSSALTGALEAGDGIWVQHGKAFAYIDGNALVLLPLDPMLPEQTVFEGDGPLAGLRATADEGTVIVEQQWSDDLATMVADEQTPVFFSVDVGTREAVMFTGLDVSDNVGWWTPPDRFLVTFEPQPEGGDTVTYQVIDAVTGETVGTLDDVPLNDAGIAGYPMLGPSSVTSSPDGNTEIIAFDSQHTHVMRLVDGEYSIQHVPAPEGILAETPMMLALLISPDGSLATMSAEGDASGTVYVLDLNADPLAWQPGWEGPMLPFLPGTGTIPASAPDLGFDFSEVPDGSGFTDGAQLAEALRTAEGTFAWPEGYDPDVERIIEGLPNDNSRHQAGGEYTILGGYNQCAWNQTWLDAHEAGDEAAAEESLRIMTEVFPTFPNQDWSVVKWQMEAAALAAEGDPAMVQQHVTVNCQGLHWE